VSATETPDFLVKTAAGRTVGLGEVQQGSARRRGSRERQESEETVLRLAVEYLRLMSGVPLSAGSRGRRRDVGQLQGVETMRAPSCRGNRLSYAVCHSPQRLVP
jgi:hypothetical protein